MATKKQKREAALARREAFLEEYRRQGLEAQKSSRVAENAKKMQEDIIEDNYIEDEWLHASDAAILHAIANEARDDLKPLALEMLGHISMDLKNEDSDVHAW